MNGRLTNNVLRAKNELGITNVLRAQNELGVTSFERVEIIFYRPKRVRANSFWARKRLYFTFSKRVRRNSF